MAIISPQSPENDLANIKTTIWENVTESDTCASVKMANLSDKTMTVTGSFGGATVVIQGSNDDVNWFNLSDAQGNEINLAVAGISLILENPLYIRPSASGGSSQDIDVIIISKD